MIGIPSKLEREFEKLGNRLDPGNTKKAMHKFGLRASKWPFVSGEVKDIIGTLERYETTINTALATDMT